MNKRRHASYNEIECMGSNRTSLLTAQLWLLWHSLVSTDLNLEYRSAEGHKSRLSLRMQEVANIPKIPKIGNPTCTSIAQDFLHIDPNSAHDSRRQHIAKALDVGLRIS